MTPRAKIITKDNALDECRIAFDTTKFAFRAVFVLGWIFVLSPWHWVDDPINPDCRLFLRGQTEIEVCCCDG